MKSNPFENFAKETSPGVYHALTWDIEVSKTIIVDLVTENGLSVCLVSEKWLVEDRVFYPTYGNYKNHKALRV